MKNFWVVNNNIEATINKLFKYCIHINHQDMKILKIMYIIALSSCAIELLLLLFGSDGIFYQIKELMFKPIKEGQVISISAVYSVDNNAVRMLKFLNKVNTLCYFLSLIGAYSSLLLHKLDRKTKYIIGISFFVASLIFSLITGPIWNHLLQKSYS
jgi:hypothetical protein